MPTEMSGRTSAPVNGSDVVVAAGGCVTLSLSTSALGCCVVGGFDSCSPRTVEQKSFASVGTQLLPPPPVVGGQPGAVGLVVQSPPPVVGGQPGAVGLVVQSPPPPGGQPGAVGLVVQSPPPPPVGVVHPVCAGLLR